MKLETFIQRVFSCSPEVAQAIRSRAALRTYSPRAPIVRQGEACVDVYLLVIGHVRALLLTADGAIIQYGMRRIAASRPARLLPFNGLT